MEQKRKIALVTGGSRGIGLGIAQALAQAGCDLAINGMRPEEAVGGTLESLRKHGGKVIYCQGNVADRLDRKRMLDKVSVELGALNVLINNAGIAPRERKDVLEASEESYEEVMKVNLQGPYFLTQAVANQMVQSRLLDKGFSAIIVNISSISATVASPNRGEYCVSKAGMAMMTALFAARLGEFDIPVYEIRPGITQTDMTAGVKGKYDKMLEEGLCVQTRWGQPDDVAKAVLACVSGLLSYSTGQVIHVDGGLTLPRL